MRLTGSKSRACRWRSACAARRPISMSAHRPRVKIAMLNAKSVKYSPTGAALMTVKKILSTLDIADKIHDSSTVRGEVPLAGEEYEINFYPLISLPNKKLKNLGAVIPQLQVPTVIEVTVGKNAADPKVALALIKFLQGPAIDQALKDYGMEKGHIGKIGGLTRADRRRPRHHCPSAPGLRRRSSVMHDAARGPSGQDAGGGAEAVKPAALTR